MSMLTKHAKRYLLIGSLLGIFSCVFGCIVITNNYNEKYPSEKFPIRTILVQIDEDQREELFAQLRKFSENHSFEFYLSFYKGKEIFLIEMYGKNLEILARPIPGVPEEINISFYEKDPTNPPSQQIVDELFIDLKVLISEIPNASILEEK